MDCINHIEHGWMATLEPDPVPVFMWIGENWILGNMEVVVLTGRLSLYLYRDWEHDPLVEVLDDFKNPPVVPNIADLSQVIVITSNSELDTIESFSENGEDKNEKINGSDSEDSSTIVIRSDDEVSKNGNDSISEEEADATTTES